MIALLISLSSFAIDCHYMLLKDVATANCITKSEKWINLYSGHDATMAKSYYNICLKEAAKNSCQRKEQAVKPDTIDNMIFQYKNEFWFENAFKQRFNSLQACEKKVCKSMSFLSRELD